MAKEKILVVDDEKDARETICEFLEEEGYEPVEARDGEEALEKTKEEALDLALIDLKMPGMDGLQLIQRIKKFNPDIQIVIITGYPSLESAREAMREEVYDYIAKPFGTGELKSTVRRSLEKRQLVMANKKLMEEVEEKYKILLENLPQKIFFKDQDSVYVSANKNYASDLGIAPEEIKGKTDFEFFPKELAEKYRADDTKVIESGRTTDFEERYIEKGKERLVHTVKTPVKDSTGKPMGVLGIFWDITGFKRAQEKEKELITRAAAAKARTRALERAREELERKVKERTREMEKAKIETEDLLTELDEAYKELKGTQEELVRREKLIAAGGLAAGVAHEIRNPLSIIGMSVQYLHSKFEDDDPRREFTEAIIDKVERLDEVTKELIDYARPRKLNLQKRNIHKILDRTLKLAKYKCDAQKVKIAKRYAKSMPRVSVDDDLMEQVFLNLMNNALWAMPKGGELKISTRIHRNKDTKQHEMEIGFTDTGCGIPKKEINRIFDPFFTTRHDGNGLGLSIVHRIIEDHEGSIDVESGVKKGTTFSIRLPISPPPKKEKKIKRERLLA